MPDDRVVGEAAGLHAFRCELYACFGAWADALFEIVDALAGAARPIRSIAELMLEPVVRRGWGSLYQALEHGEIDVGRLRDLLARQVASAAGPAPGPAVFAVDASKYPRPDTRYVPDLGLQHSTAGSEQGTVVAGWMMQWVVQVAQAAQAGPREAPPLTQPALPCAPTPAGDQRLGGSWTAPMDVRRVGTSDNANEVAAVQISELASRLSSGWARGGAAPLFLLDAGYCPIYLTQQLNAQDGVDAQILVRLRSDRVFFARPDTTAPARVGRPAKHGPRFALNQPDTWGEPDEQCRSPISAADPDQPDADGPDAVTVHVQAWHHKHPRPRQRRKWEGNDLVEGTLIRREERHRSGRVQVWWLWWSGPAEAFDLRLLGDVYRHRFAIEHTFRFNKQDLFWTGHTPLEPEQAERWSWVVAAAYAQLTLARPLTLDQRLPWERQCTPQQLSPRRVRRGFRGTTADLPTPARAPKPSRPGNGRPPGAKNKRTRTRRPVIRKGRPDNTGHPKGRSPRARQAPPP